MKALLVYPATDIGTPFIAEACSAIAEALGMRDGVVGCVDAIAPEMTGYNGEVATADVLVFVRYSCGPISHGCGLAIEAADLLSIPVFELGRLTNRLTRWHPAEDSLHWDYADAVETRRRNATAIRGDANHGRQLEHHGT